MSESDHQKVRVAAGVTTVDNVLLRVIKFKLNPQTFSDNLKPAHRGGALADTVTRAVTRTHWHCG